MQRRTFLRMAPAGAGMLAYARPTSKPRKASDIAISSTNYTPADYPIRPKRYSEVTLQDTFWKPKVQINAEVTIPSEFQKAAEDRPGRGLRSGVLEAAILSLKTHPDPRLQTQVDAAVQSIIAAPTRGNSGFEIAATHFQTTGKRELLDQSI